MGTLPEDELLDHPGPPRRGPHDPGQRGPPPSRAATGPTCVPSSAHARTRLEVDLVYGGEGETPSPLPVRPRLTYQWKEKAYLEGECLRSGLLKTYRLDRVHRVRAR